MKIETQLSHNTLHFVLKFLVFVGSIQKTSLEDGVHKDLVPRNPILFLFLKTLCKKVYCSWGEVCSANAKGDELYILDKLKLSPGTPGRISM